MDMSAIRYVYDACQAPTTHDSLTMRYSASQNESDPDLLPKARLIENELQDRGAAALAQSFLSYSIHLSSNPTASDEQLGTADCLARLAMALQSEPMQCDSEAIEEAREEISRLRTLCEEMQRELVNLVKCIAARYSMLDKAVVAAPENDDPELGLAVLMEPESRRNRISLRDLRRSVLGRQTRYAYVQAKAALDRFMKWVDLLDPECTDVIDYEEARYNSAEELLADVNLFGDVYRAAILNETESEPIYVKVRRGQWNVIARLSSEERERELSTMVRHLQGKLEEVDRAQRDLDSWIGRGRQASFFIRQYLTGDGPVWRHDNALTASVTLKELNLALNYSEAPSSGALQ